MRLASAIKMIAQLGTPRELRAAAPVDEPFLANAHIHLPPNFSAYESVEDAVGVAAAEGVRLLGASNYYDFSVYGRFAAAAKRQRIFPLYGVEIIAMLEDMRREGVRVNDPANPGRMYICGKGITRFAPMGEPAATTMRRIRRADNSRARRMIVLLAGIFEAGGCMSRLDRAAVVEQIVKRHGVPRRTVVPQERHIAQAFQRALFECFDEDERRAAAERIIGAAVDDEAGVQSEIRARLMKAGKPAYVSERFVTFEEAYALILALGGIPCYPTLADGAKAICEYESDVDALMADLARRGIHAAEFIPVRNRPETLSRYVPAMRRAGLVITAGTEHNTLDRISMRPTAAGGEAVPAEVEAIFREGACVAAAHEYLSARGERGYVDERGRLNSAWSDREERIRDLAALGARVIGRFTAKEAR